VLVLVELADHRGVMAIVAIGGDDRSVDQLVEAMGGALVALGRRCGGSGDAASLAAADRAGDAAAGRLLR
jgi:hypothetical protein